MHALRQLLLLSECTVVTPHAICGNYLRESHASSRPARWSLDVTKRLGTDTSKGPQAGIELYSLHAAATIKAFHHHLKWVNGAQKDRPNSATKTPRGPHKQDNKRETSQDT
ncbi:hypothetical protein JOB18_006950 [Solea senegalensis]|uniref:Secreted protein n=1 Tax=Solea senegalensis TaxID=28829 RepID=A0AAV6QGR6_SOLSE|nr:hypothetical protein JOB18_006950 [Solea senegalensis]